MDRHRRSYRLLVAATAIVVALGACGDDDDSNDTTAPAATEAARDADTGANTIVIVDLAYQVPLEVPAGVTVTVRNDDQVTHTVTADDGSFDVEVAGGATQTFSAPSAGSYAFHCEIHAAMTGELQVA